MIRSYVSFWTFDVSYPFSVPVSLSSGIVLFFLANFVGALGDAQASVQDLCKPKILAQNILVTPEQRGSSAINRISPPGVVGATGFDWSDTQLGVTEMPANGE